MPDGMACFGGRDGNWQLLRNHELSRSASQGAYPRGQPDFAYRKYANGGVSRLVIDPNTLRVLSSNMVLTGTLRNCAGGATPWGWISCEETTEPEHGYSFLCSAEAAQLSPPRRIAAYGRFRHEAVALDPQTYRAYLTEDDPMGCLYRFTPSHRARPFEGKLEALRVVGQPQFDTASRMDPSKPCLVDWVPIDDPDAKLAPLNQQARGQGAAPFARAEGAWMDGDGVVFTATTGGKEGRGQIFRLALGPDALSLVAEAQGESMFNGPDNITVAPWGDFLVAEDGPGPQHVHGVRRDGSVYPILRNDLSSSELAGVCFSPDGKVLFVNVQVDGLTVAVRGPWETLLRSA